MTIPMPRRTSFTEWFENPTSYQLRVTPTPHVASQSGARNFNAPTSYNAPVVPPVKRPKTVGMGLFAPEDEFTSYNLNSPEKEATARLLLLSFADVNGLTWLLSSGRSLELPSPVGAGVLVLLVVVVLAGDRQLPWLSSLVHEEKEKEQQSLLPRREGDGSSEGESSPTMVELSTVLNDGGDCDAARSSWSC
ncbi:hypothetical protein MTR67_001462 [Solanum verrucosum]|uniref:Uncharacterized protein n=1 Tax=Solanum verrucosum TaxID=315347 RepID=A0AAF0T532_SOLVR|nr:hypothetical protein MTR67_001462 [Solanum verrucosum]